ncbi:MAG TPA: hypothetical protein VHD69_00280 [Candidatus Paceibacterota bacterium]|nr:hypothetical protein [Candidatus Paceibacterota bacterium]
MHTIQSPENRIILSRGAPDWWNVIGESVYRPNSRDTLHGRLVYSTGEREPDHHMASAHAIIAKGDNGSWLVRRKIFAKVFKPEPDKEPLFEKEDRYSRGELILAFDHRMSMPSPFAQGIRADAGASGKFIRIGPYLALGDPVKKPSEAMFILVQDFIRIQVRLFTEASG